MTASTSMSVFCQWLLAESAGQHPSCAIMLHGDPTLVNDHLIQDVTDYLNEYDDAADGIWLSATNELVQKVANDPSNRRLLGLADLQNQSDANTHTEFLKALVAIGKKGHIVCLSPVSCPDDLQTSKTFHAGVGAADTIHKECHMILNPDRIDQKSIPSIIADVFLEWLNCTERAQTTQQRFR
jgi:hypothetical protein